MAGDFETVMINRVVPPADRDTATMAMAEKIATNRRCATRTRNPGAEMAAESRSG